MLIPKKNRREVYKYLFKGELKSFAVCQATSSSTVHASADSASVRSCRQVATCLLNLCV
jgi:hypothetical protein